MDHLFCDSDPRLFVINMFVTPTKDELGKLIERVYNSPIESYLPDLI